LIPEDDKHTILSRTERIEVIPDTLITYKIPCLKRMAPCKLYFRYPNEAGRHDLRVFVSCEESIPTDKKCDQNLSLPVQITVDNEG
jgi:hypothetical protein